MTLGLGSIAHDGLDDIHVIGGATFGVPLAPLRFGNATSHGDETVPGNIYRDFRVSGHDGDPGQVHQLIAGLHVKYRAHNPHPATGAGDIAVEKKDLSEGARLIFLP